MTARHTAWPQTGLSAVPQLCGADHIREYVDPDRPASVCRLAVRKHRRKLLDLRDSERRDESTRLFRAAPLRMETPAINGHPTLVCYLDRLHVVDHMGLHVGFGRWCKPDVNFERLAVTGERRHDPIAVAQASVRRSRWDSCGSEVRRPLRAVVASYHTSRIATALDSVIFSPGGPPCRAAGGSFFKESDCIRCLDRSPRGRGRVGRLNHAHTDNFRRCNVRMYTAWAAPDVRLHPTPT